MGLAGKVRGGGVNIVNAGLNTRRKGGGSHIYTIHYPFSLVLHLFDNNE